MLQLGGPIITRWSVGVCCCYACFCYHYTPNFFFWRKGKLGHFERKPEFEGLSGFLKHCSQKPLDRISKYWGKPNKQSTSWHEESIISWVKVTQQWNYSCMNFYSKTSVSCDEISDLLLLTSGWIHYTCARLVANESQLLYSLLCLTGPFVGVCAALRHDCMRRSV